MTYFHHCANCLVEGSRPLPYVRWLKIRDSILFGA